MIKLMVPVVRDLVAETAGIPSSVGSSVEVIKKIPKYSPLQVSVPGMGNPRTFPVRRDVYLVNAPRTRWFDDENPLRAAMIVYLMMQESE